MKSVQTTPRKSSRVAAGKTDPSLLEKRESTEAPMASSDAEKREAMIRIAAYSFYERRGLVGGHELEDWLQAEMEVDRQLAAATPPTGAK